MQPDNACPGEAGGGRSAVQFADDGGGEERLDGTTSGEAAESGRVVPKRDSSRYVSAMFSDYHRAELARRMTRLGAVDTGISLEVFRQLWLAVMPQRTGWSETEQTFDEIDVDGSGFIEFEELLVYLETWSRKRADEATIVHPSSCKQWSWLFVGTAQEAVAVDREGNTRVLVTVALPIYRVFSQFMVLVSVGIIMAESMPELQKQDGESGNDTTFAIETVCILFFSLELLVYTWSYPGPWYKWLRDKATWVDVISIAPYYVRLVWTTSTSGVQEASAVRVTRMVRLLRALRALRVLRLTSGSGRVSKVPQLLRVLRESAVPLFWLLILIFIITVLSASIIFFIEKEEAEFRMKEQRWFRDNTSSYKDAGEPTHFQSIPEVMWWTLAAVSAGEQGYDEYAPVTNGGRFVGALAMLSSLVVISLPISIVMDVFQRMHRKAQQDAERRGLCSDFYRGLILWLERREGQLPQQGVQRKAASPRRRGTNQAAGMMQTFTTDPTLGVSLSESRLDARGDTTQNVAADRLDRIEAQLAELHSLLAGGYAPPLRPNPATPPSRKGVCRRAGPRAEAGWWARRTCTAEAGPAVPLGRADGRLRIQHCRSARRR
eukprot:TRINITY_DN2072_c0_g1_i2.p1 TRINITY_DN2072_c0_g1~~TRINITY_DN2072_c0_g1_i2.p1  ORF type:complete len:621 (+),score=171.74 TRINITY_DN2072_c0_g1_i2:51-1865(+)